MKDDNGITRLQERFKYYILKMMTQFLEISDWLPGEVADRFAAVLYKFETDVYIHITAVNTDIPVAGSIAQFSLWHSARIVAVQLV